MSRDLSVDLTSGVPVYEQLRGQLAGMIAAGELTAGERLPTVRALAADLGIAVNTVGRAYSELEASGRVTSQRRRGTIVTGSAVAPPAQLIREAERLARTAFATGVPVDTVFAVIRAAMARSAAEAVKEPG